MNFPTLIVLLIVITIFLLIVINQVSNFIKGKHSCSGNCGTCKSCDNIKEVFKKYHSEQQKV